MSEESSEPSQKFKMGRFSKIVNGQNLLIMFIKHSILDVWQVSVYPFDVTLERSYSVC